MYTCDSLSKICPFHAACAWTLVGVCSGDHQGEDRTLLATTSCTRPAAERRRDTASWWDSPTSDWPLIMRSSSPAVSLPSLQKHRGNTELQGGPSSVLGSGGMQWDVEAWTSDLADAKLALISTVSFTQKKWLRKVPPGNHCGNQSHFSLFAVWAPQTFYVPHWRWPGSSSEPQSSPTKEQGHGWH